MDGGKQARGGVALFLPNFAGGGAERATLTLAAGLLHAGCAVLLVVAADTGPLRDLVPPGAEIVDLGTRRISRSILALRSWLRAARPAAVLSALTHANAVAVLASRGTGIRVVVSEHNTLSEYGSAATALSDRLQPLAARVTYRYADAVVAVTEGVASDLRRRLAPRPPAVTVISNAVDAQRVRAQAAQPVAAPWRTEGVPTIVSAGRLVDQKDHAMLLRAFADVIAQRPARLLLIGEGPRRQALEGLAEELRLSQAVTFLGHQDNPYPYLAGADVVALSSRFEGQSLVLIEALSLGAKIVSTDCPWGPAEILQDGRYGRLVGVGDAGSFATALLTAIDAPRPDIPPEALAAYAPGAVAQRYLELLVP